MHHPKRDEYDQMMLDPKHKPVNPAGHWDQLGAQDRCILRRHIREHFKDYAKIADISNMDVQQLSHVIEMVQFIEDKQSGE